MAFVRKDKSREVPVHLRNAPTKLMKELGYGHEYRYAHDEPNAYAAGETYLPDGMPEPRWYQPVPRGVGRRRWPGGERLAGTSCASWMRTRKASSTINRTRTPRSTS
jgi:replication-associated recombination protein RarA